MPVIRQEQKLFACEEHLKSLSESGDPLEVLDQVIDFELFRPALEQALNYGDGRKGGRPHFDPVMMFKAAILQARHNLSDAKTEFMIRDRLSWLRFLGFGLGDRTPDENTIRLFRNRLSEGSSMEALLTAFDQQLRQAGYLPVAGQIIDASLVSSPKQRNSVEEKEAIKAGKSAQDIWPESPNKAAQKDCDARWTLKVGGKSRLGPGGKPLPQIATPTFGYKTHISIDRRFGFIRRAHVTSAAEPDGRQLAKLVDKTNTAGDVWADTAYRSKENEAWLAEQMLCSRIHHKKPKGKPMPEKMARANARKSSVRARVEHVFAHQKNRFGLFIRTIGLKRAEAKLTFANLAYNFDRLVFHQRA